MQKILVKQKTNRETSQGCSNLYALFSFLIHVLIEIECLIIFQENKYFNSLSVRCKAYTYIPHFDSQTVISKFGNQCFCWFLLRNILGVHFIDEFSNGIRIAIKIESNKLNIYKSNGHSVRHREYERGAPK